jgi:hypothetical protein
MIDHWDDDVLLKSVLGLAEARQEGQLQDHLRDCSTCRLKYERLKAEIEIIGSFNPPIGVAAPSLPKAVRIPFKSLLKIAALLTVGFLTGYVASELTQPVAVNVSEQYIQTRTVPASPAAFTTCDQDDILVAIF